jgi:hypothetical protein
MWTISLPRYDKKLNLLNRLMRSSLAKIVYVTDATMFTNHPICDSKVRRSEPRVE